MFVKFLNLIVGLILNTGLLVLMRTSSCLVLYDIIFVSLLAFFVCKKFAQNQSIIYLCFLQNGLSIIPLLLIQFRFILFVSVFFLFKFCIPKFQGKFCVNMYLAAKSTVGSRIEHKLYQKT